MLFFLFSTTEQQKKKCIYVYEVSQEDNSARWMNYFVWESAFISEIKGIWCMNGGFGRREKLSTVNLTSKQ